MTDVEPSQYAIQRLFSERMLKPYADIMRANNRRIFEAAAAQVALPQRAQLENALAAISGTQIQRFSALAREANLFHSVITSLTPSLERIGGALKNCMPVNWPESVFIGEAVPIVSAGIPLVWVPRPAIGAELVAAGDEQARRAVLTASAAAIAEDCSAVLAEVTGPDLKDLCALAAEAADALPGFPAAAQALAANVFDTLLRDVCRRGVVLQPVPDHGWYRRVRSQIKTVGDETLMINFRQTCVMTPAWAALQTYMPGDPPPQEFVRHATAHRAGRVQYSQVNAIISVMLAASMLREAQESGW